MKKNAIVLLTSAIIIIMLTALTSCIYALTWTSEVQLTSVRGLSSVPPEPEDDYAPSIANSKDRRIWVFWHESSLFTDSNIFYKVYNGVTWSGEIQFTKDPGEDIQPAALVTKDGTIWVFWSTDRDGDYSIYYRNSADNGTTWSDDTQIPDANFGSNKRPYAMQASDGMIWVVWFTNRDGNDEVYYNFFDGTWWYICTNLTYNASRDWNPTITQSSDGALWVFWERSGTGNDEIFYKVSSDNGETWSTDIQLTNNIDRDEDPSATTTQNGQIWVAWQSDRNNQWDIFYKVFNGSSWSSDASLVSSSIDDMTPTIFKATNTTIWVAWSKGGGSNDEYHVIYYKLTLADHDLEITDVTPFASLVYQGYSSEIHVTVKNSGLNTETFNVTAYINSATIGTQRVTNLAAGTHGILTFPWNTTGLSYGNYTLAATANPIPGEEDTSDNTCLGGLVIITIPGDVNGDKYVNILDGATISAHWYSGPDGPNGPLGYDSRIDINGDGIIDIVDYGIMSVNFGQSW